MRPIPIVFIRTSNYFEDANTIVARALVTSCRAGDSSRHLFTGANEDKRGRHEHSLRPRRMEQKRPFELSGCPKQRATFVSNNLHRDRSRASVEGTGQCPRYLFSIVFSAAANSASACRISLRKVHTCALLANHPPLGDRAPVVIDCRANYLGRCRTSASPEPCAPRHSLPARAPDIPAARSPAGLRHSSHPREHPRLPSNRPLDRRSRQARVPTRPGPSIWHAGMKRRHDSESRRGKPQVSAARLRSPRNFRPALQTRGPGTRKSARRGRPEARFAGEAARNRARSPSACCEAFQRLPIFPRRGLRCANPQERSSLVVGRLRVRGIRRRHLPRDRGRFSVPVHSLAVIPQ